MDSQLHQLRNLCILFALFLLFIGNDAYAGKNYTWDGSTDSSWTVASNWTAGGGAPADPSSGTQADYQINGTYTNAPVISSTPTGFNMRDCGISGGSLVQMRGGTVNFTRDVAISGGSDLVITGGTMNIAGNLYIFDGGTTITVNGGDLNVTGDILMGNNGGQTEGSNGVTSITLSSGSISCANLAYDNSTGDTHGVTVSGGTFTISGDIRSDGEDVNMTINNSSAIVDVGDDITMTGGGDLLTMSDGILRLRGDWNNSGTTNLTGGSVRFEGTTSSNITNASGGETFYFMSVNKSLGGVNLNDSIIIDFRMALLSGVVTTNGNSVTFVDDASPSIFSSSSYIDGPINKIGNEIFVFPTGDGIFYNPIELSTTPNTSADMYRAEYFIGSPDGLYPIANREGGLATVSQVEYWTLDRLIGTSAEKVTLYWNAGSLVGNLTDLRVLRWDAGDSEWKNEGNGGTTGTTSSGDIESAAAITDFSPFTLGSTTINNPLPVELLSFNAKAIGSDVVVSWTTAAEINNNRFEIIKTVDGIEFETIAVVESKAEGGNSTETLYYSLHDPIDFDHSAYYRLVQIDHDGTRKEYPFLAVHLNGQRISVTEENAHIYPNPVLEEEFTLQINTDKEIDIYLFNLKGQSIQISQSKLNENSYRVELNEKVESGIYFVNLIERSTSQLISSEKLIIQ